MPKDGFTYKTYLVNKSDSKNANSKSNIVSSEIYPHGMVGYSIGFQYLVTLSNNYNKKEGVVQKGWQKASFEMERMNNHWPWDKVKATNRKLVTPNSCTHDSSRDVKDQ